MLLECLCQKEKWLVTLGLALRSSIIGYAHKVFESKCFNFREDDDGDVDQNIITDLDHDCGKLDEHINSKLQHMEQLALFLLKTKEVRKVSQTALDGLLADFTLIIQQTLHEVKYNL